MFSPPSNFAEEDFGAEGVDEDDTVVIEEDGLESPTNEKMHAAEGESEEDEDDGSDEGDHETESDDSVVIEDLDAEEGSTDASPRKAAGGSGKKSKRGKEQGSGCSCKKSACLKLYCECYAKLEYCGTSCKCVGCKNTDDPQHKVARDQVKTSIPSDNT